MRFLGTRRHRYYLGVTLVCFHIFGCGCSEEKNEVEAQEKTKPVWNLDLSKAVCPVLASGQEASLWPGDDGDLKLGAGSEISDDERYVLRDDGILEDHLTGLMWMFKAPYWSGVMKESAYREYKLRLIQDAKVGEYISEINKGSLSGSNRGYSDWRWPTVEEGITLFRFWGMSRRGPKMNVPADFIRDLGDTAKRRFTTCTPFQQETNQRYEVSFSGWKEFNPDGPDEQIITPVRTMTHAEVRDADLRVTVRAVGPRGEDPVADKQWPSPRFKIYGLATESTSDDIVGDQLTGLFWARDAGAPGELPWFKALEYCEKLELGGFSDWRMPNIMEQLSLLCFGCNSPVLCNTSGDGSWKEGDPFLGVKYAPFWTSTGYELNHAKIYTVNLTDGALESEWVGESPLNAAVIKILSREQTELRVWPVRGGRVFKPVQRADSIVE